jgi:hypothetical protein
MRYLNMSGPKVESLSHVTLHAVASRAHCVFLPSTSTWHLPLRLDEPTRTTMSISCIRQSVDHLDATDPPIARLSHDVLLMVFMFCRPYTSVGSGKDIEYGNARCLAFAQVCASWRALALRTPGLWTCIDFAWPSFAEGMLRRAGHAHLDVFWSDPQIELVFLHQLGAKMGRDWTRKSEGLMIAIWEATMFRNGTPANFAEVQRAHHRAHRLLRDPISAITAMSSSVRLLCIEHHDGVRSQEEFQALLSGFDCPVPALERLIIRISSTTGAEPRHTAALTISVLVGNAPRLRSLELRDCHILPSWSLYAQLRELSLCYGHSRIGLQKLLSTLVAAPLLERLRIEYAIEQNTTQRVCETSTVHLSHLEHLFVKDICTNDTLRFLWFPPPRTLIVSDLKWRLSNNEPIVDDITDILDGMSHILDSTRGRIRLSRVRLTYTAWMGGRVECFDLGADRADEGDAWLSVAHRWPTFAAFSDAWIRATPLAAMRVLEVQAHDESRPAWPAFFAELSALEVVTLAGSSTIGAVQALATEGLCPRLRCLRLRRAHVCMQADPPGAALTDVLMDLLRARIASGSPIASVELHEMHEEAMVTLRQAIISSGVSVEVVTNESWTGSNEDMEERYAAEEKALWV